MTEFDETVAPKLRPIVREGRNPASEQSTARGAGTDRSGLLRLQRQAGNAAVVQRLQGTEDQDSVERARGAGGQALDPATRVQMEQAFATDFGDVRLHTGTEADASARGFGAHAYTVGNDVVFSRGGYEPGTDAGRRTLAHELTHVVQQRSGPVDGTDTGAGVKMSDPSDRFEQAAETAAANVISGNTAAGQTTAGTGGAAVQRQEDEEDVQTLVQREEMPEEEPEQEPG